MFFKKKKQEDEIRPLPPLPSICNRRKKDKREIEFEEESFYLKDELVSSFLVLLDEYNKAETNFDFHYVAKKIFELVPEISKEGFDTSSIKLIKSRCHDLLGDFDIFYKIPDVWFVEIENNYTKVSFVKLKSKIKGD